MKPEKMQVLVTFPKMQDVSKRKVVEYVREAVRGHADNPSYTPSFYEQASAATAKEHKREPLVTELMDESNTRREAFTALAIECDNLKKEIKLLRAREVGMTPADKPDAVVMFGAITHAINAIDHTEWLPQGHQRREYAKAGGIAVLKRVGAAVQMVANTLMAHPPKPTDGDLFMYWVTEAATRPARLATALQNCIAPQEYRDALVALYEQDIEAHKAGRIVEQGGLIK
jgi:hypothetical protein